MNLQMDMKMILSIKEKVNQLNLYWTEFIFLCLENTYFAFLSVIYNLQMVK